MNEENQFSIDVRAESQAISPLIQEGLSTPSEFINIQPDIPLPDPVLYQATDIDLSETVKAESAQVSGLDFDVKVDVEAVYERTEQLEEKMGEMYGGFQDLYENVKKMDIKVNFYGDNENILETLIVTHHRPKPIITPHPHAEMIAKYAEVAQRRVDPCVEFEWFDDCLGKWVVFKEMSPMFSFRKIRHIGETK